MAKYELATWKPIPPQEELEASRGSAVKKTQVILHSAQGTYPGSVDWWKSRWQFKVYSTFFVRSSGEVVQLVDSSYYAPANASANLRAISVESDDNTKPDTFPWNDKQLDALVKLIQWAGKTHGIPLKPCPAHDQPGIGFHTMWGNKPSISPWLGGKKENQAKTCPGLIRIEQFYKDILPALGYAPADDEDEIVFARWQPPPNRRAPVPKPGGTKILKKTQKAPRGRAVALRDEEPFVRRTKNT